MLTKFVRIIRVALFLFFRVMGVRESVAGFIVFAMTGSVLGIYWMIPHFVMVSVDIAAIALLPVALYRYVRIYGKLRPVKTNVANRLGPMPRHFSLARLGRIGLARLNWLQIGKQPRLAGNWLDKA